MPAAVHALLVVRSDGRSAAAHLRRTLEALRAQNAPVRALTVVLCGATPELTAIARESGAEGVITAPRTTGYATALRMASGRVTGDAVWLLAQDTAPAPDALARLSAVLEAAPSVAIAAPKLVAWDESDEIVSLGVSMTRYGRTVDLVDGELDQGQHDATTDVLGADVRGLLVRAERWAALDGLDAGLGGGDEGLDLGVRARLAGDRVSLAPRALVAVAGDGVAGLPDRRSAAHRRRRVLAARRAQVHRRLVYAPGVAVPLHWLSLLPLALWRTIVHLFSKAPSRVGAEWAAAVLGMVRLAGVARARGRIRRTRRVPWAQLAPLRVSSEQLRTRLDSDSAGAAPPGAVPRGDLRFFTGGGAWVVLGALIVSLAAFPMLLVWPTLGGGAVAPLASTVGQLWADAAWGLRSTGLATIGPADPFAAVVAVVGSLWPFEPSRVLAWLWLVALPLAVLGGWFAATRLTERSLVRIVAAVAWGLAPTFLAALTEARPAAVLAHLLLPWLFYASSVAFRSWSAAGAGSLLLVAVVACAPALAPALLALWGVAIVLVVAARAGRGIARVIWLIVPTVALAAPLVWRQTTTGNAWALLTDPGPVWAGPQVTSDAAGRALLAAGFPTADPGGWGAFVSGVVGADVPTGWVALFVLPLGILALVAPLTRRFAAGIVLLAVAVGGIGTAFFAVGVATAFDGDVSVAVWPGAALSLAWLGLVGAAVVTLDSGFAARDLAGRRIVSTIVLTTSCLLAVPALSAADRGASSLASGSASTLPAYVAAEGAGDAPIGTLVLTPTASGGVATTVVWGPSATLGGASTLESTKTRLAETDEAFAALTADIVSPVADDVVSRLADHGVSFILLTPAPDTDPARALRLGAETALDQRAQLDAVGATSRGTLWRVTVPVAPRAAPSDASTAVANAVSITQLAAVGIAVLLAVPTAATRRAGRYTPRVVGAKAGAA